MEDLVKGLDPKAWTRQILREGARGMLQVEIVTRRVWVWDGEETRARRWRLVVRREVASPETIKYSLSNAPEDTPLLRQAQTQGHRYWVERGMADCQALSWRSWHHHMTMVMLAMLFIADQRMDAPPGLELLTPSDVVEMLKGTLPRNPEGKPALAARINARQKRRLARHPIPLPHADPPRGRTGGGPPGNVTLSN